MIEEAAQTDATTELARQRSQAAADRTLMAWVRTSLSMIAFGFGIDKVVQFIRESSPDRRLASDLNTRIFGVAFVALGVLSLLVAAFQHLRTVRRIREAEYVYVAPLPLILLIALLLVALGIFALFAMF